MASREPLHRFFRGELDWAALLSLLVVEPDWLVFGDRGRLSGIVLNGEATALVFTDRAAVEAFAARGGDRMQTAGGPLVEALEAWDRGFYIFHDLAGAAAVAINMLSEVPDALHVESEVFDVAQRLARDALVVDVVKAGPEDPRFCPVLKRHDAFRVIAAGDPLLALPGGSGERAALVFTSQKTLERFLEKFPPPQQVPIATVDGAALFPQLEQHGYSVLFDHGSAHSVAYGPATPRFVLDNG